MSCVYFENKVLIITTTTKHKFNLTDNQIIHTQEEFTNIMYFNIHDKIRLMKLLSNIILN